MKFMKVFIATIALFGGINCASAQDYPSDAITFIVPYAAGGTTDIIGRTVADKLSDKFGVPVVVENRSGAGGTIGTTIAAQAEPDGYTLLVTAVSPHGIAPSLYPNLHYDAIEDFQPIVNLVSIPNVMVVNPDLPVKTVEEFIAYAKAHPGELNMASSGIGSSIHLSGEMFKAKTGIDMIHVPFEGSAPAVTSLLSGRTDVMFDNLPSAIPYIRSGKLRALAVTTQERSPALPDVPTIAEATDSENLDDFAAMSWFALVAPAGIPKPIVQKLNNAVNEVLADPEVVKLLKERGMNIRGGTPEELAEWIKSELDKWAEVIDAAGVSLGG